MKVLLKKILPENIFNYLKKNYLINKDRVIRLFAKKIWLSSIYYTLFSKSFRREFYSVINGKGSYLKSLNNINKSSPLLRRNIHRLEKGLIMRPRRSIFAESFILETVSCFEKAMHTEGVELKELKWANDILSLYFSVVDKTEIIKESEDKYRRINLENLVKDTELYIPYEKKDSISSSLKFEDIKKLFKARRSTRWYLDKKVNTNLVIEAANAAGFAPSACNRQPYRFVYITEKNKVGDVARCVKGTVGFLENIPSIMVVIGDLSCYEFERDRHLIYIDSSLATMQLVLALETLGLSSCILNFPDIEESEDKIKKLIPIEKYERVIMLISIGYPDPSGCIPYSQKKTNESIISLVEL